MSHKITVVTANGTTTATAEEAKIGDIITTLFSTDQAVTGTYGLVQKAGLVVAGMSFQSQRKSGSWNFLN